MSSNILHEFEDRQSRRNNAIFFGVDEAASTNAAERRKTDQDTVQTICNSIAENIIITGCTRIGNFSTVSLQPRPLKVFFSSPRTNSPRTKGQDISGRTGSSYHTTSWYSDHHSDSSSYVSIDPEKFSIMNKSFSSLLIYYQNVRSINTKLNDIFHKTYLPEFDLYIFTETWLKPGVFNSEIFSNMYSIFRCDRREIFRNCIKDIKDIRTNFNVANHYKNGDFTNTNNIFS